MYNPLEETVTVSPEIECGGNDQIQIKDVMVKEEEVEADQQKTVVVVFNVRGPPSNFLCTLTVPPLPEDKNAVNFTIEIRK
ncbi:MAG: hypothetical protein ABIH34_04145 [Nanoarchaeota archaeon]